MRRIQAVVATLLVGGLGTALLALQPRCAGDSIACSKIPGCIEQCCDLANLCAARVCQGITYVCRESGGSYRWVRDGQSCTADRDSGGLFDIGIADGPGSPDLGRRDTGRTDSKVSRVDSKVAKTDSSAVQGRSCSNSGVTFSANSAPARCQNIRIVAKAKSPYAWVMIGIKGSSGGYRWKGGAKDISCSSGTCSWTFDTKTPCVAGPFRFALMRDAVNDNASVGTVVGSCKP